MRVTGERAPGGGSAGGGPGAEEVYDVGVVGLGVMGTAAAWQLARRGARVLALERFAPGHDRGSSHGESRMVREAYFESPMYVPIVRRAFELWRELGERSGRTLLHQVGGLMVGPADGTLVSRARRAADEHVLEVEILEPDEIRSRFPAFRPGDEVVGIHDPGSGYVLADAGVEAMRREAEEHGARLRFEEPVEEWSQEAGGVQLRTSAGRYRVDRLVVAAGAWMRALLPGLDLPLEVERQVLWWLEPRSDPEAFAPERCPVFLAEYEPDRFFYGFPMLGSGVKVSIFHEGEVHAHPGAVRRDVSPREADRLRALLARLVPEADGRLLRHQVCLFTNTPDHDFVLDFHPEHPRVLVCSPCSGHGFKFAPAIGEIAADLLLEGDARFDLGPFRLGRLLG